MIIYKITNTFDGKCYIGQTSQSFNERYKLGKWWYYTSSPYLKNAAKKYGYKNFTVEIIDRTASSFEELNALEDFYIKKFNCIIPFGYNCQSGGKNFKKARMTVLKSALNRRKVKEIKFKNNYSGEIKEFETITDAAVFFGRKLSNVVNVLNRKRSSVGHWTLPDVSMKYWIFHHIDGRKEKIVEGDGHLFAQKHGLSKDDMKKLLSGLEVKEWIANFLFIGENCKTRPIRNCEKTSLMIRGQNFHKQRIWIYDPKQSLCLKIKQEPNMIDKIIPFFQGYKRYQVESIFYKKRRTSVSHILISYEPFINQSNIIDLTA